MFDTIQVILWSVTYCLIVIFGVTHWEEKGFLMPPIACCLNFAWEISAALWSHGSVWGHLVWLSLDLLIFAQNFYKTSGTKRKVWYLLLTLSAITTLLVLFHIPNVDGMLYSGFTIDLIMAIDYVVHARTISRRGKPLIAASKFLGDLFALIAYYNQSTAIAIIGSVVFLLNLWYLSWCLEESKRRR